MLYSLDTETTGSNFNKGCMPFFVSMCSEEGKQLWWEWWVSPYTRLPVIPDEDKKEIRGILLDEENRFVLQNTNFDMKALSSIDIFENLDEIVWFLENKVEDTLIASHVINNLDDHSLTGLGRKYLGKPKNDTEDKLAEIVKKCRVPYANWLSWRKAEQGDPHFPSAKSITWHKLDMWMPRRIWYEKNILKRPQLKDETNITDEYQTCCQKYACNDTMDTMLLWLMQTKFMITDVEEGEKQYPGLDFWRQYKEQLRLLPSIYLLQEKGVSTREFIHKERERYSQLLERHKSKCVTLANSKKFKNINLNSPAQKAKFLHKVLGEPITDRNPPNKNTKKEWGVQGQPIVNNDAVIDIWSKSVNPDTIEFTENLLCASKLGTTIGYLDSYISSSSEVSYKCYISAQEEYNNDFSLNEALRYESIGAPLIKINRTYPYYNQTGTQTTRTSSSDPNIQNVGKKETGSTLEDESPKLAALYKGLGINLRSVFGPGPGRIWYALDYSQLQLRIFAYISGSTDLIEAFNKGMDAHDYTARKIFGVPDDQEVDTLKRRIAKNVNFGFIFGASPRKIEATAGKPGLWEVVKQQFPDAIKFLQQQKKQVETKGYVTTTSGYPLHIQKKLGHKAVNYIVQGDEAIIVKRAMVKVNEYLHKLCKDHSILYGNDHFMTMMIHDELVFDCIHPDLLQCRKAAFENIVIKQIKTIMEDAGKSIGMVTPVDCDRIEENWSDGVKVVFT